MSIKGEKWDEEYRKKYFESEKVQRHQENFRLSVSKTKTEEQKKKMSAAKADRVYTEEHRANMSATQLRRQEIKKQLLEQNPDLPLEKVWELVRQEMHNV